MKKTIVQILRSPEGGIRKHVVDILENLPNDKYKKIFITSLAESDRDLKYLEEKHGVIFFDLKINDKPGLKDIVNIFKIYSYLKNEKDLILHGHGAKGGLYARICSRVLGAKSVYTPHGGSLHRVFGKFKSIIYDAVERFLILFTDKFIFESNYSAEEFRKYVGEIKDKEIINYNGVHFPDFSKEEQYKPHKTLRLASFGLLRHLKGHDILIDALRILDQKNIAFTYVIYGYGERFLELQKQIQSFGLQEKIKIESYSDNILKKMMEFDLILHPSRFESFGYVPVEAMSVKVPVITSFEGGLKEVSIPGGTFVVKSNKAEDYAKLLVEIFNGEYDLEEMTEIAHREAARKFSITTMVKNLDTIYRSLIS